MPLKEAQIGFILLDPVVDVCSKCLFKSKHDFYSCYEEGGLLKMNPSIHCLENEMATAYQNIGKITVN